VTERTAPDFTHGVERANSGCVKFDARAARFGRADIIPLWVADMDFAAPEAVQQALKTRVEHPVYGYAIYPPDFYSAIQNWLSAHYAWPVDTQAIVPLPGVVPTLSLLVHMFSQPGEGVLVQTPVYPPIHQMPNSHHRLLLENTLRWTPEGYEIDWDDFAIKVKQARLFILCSPHNPVGRVWRRDELTRMAEICADAGVLILSDEIHADLVYAPNRHIPIASLSPEVAANCITLNAPSKTFNIAGLNTAFAIIENPELRRRVQDGVINAGLGSGNVFGITALIAAYRSGADWLSTLLDQLKANRDRVCRFLEDDDLGIRVKSPEATFLLWLDCRELMRRLGLKDDDALSAFFVEQAGLGLNPGNSFGQGGSGFMRLNIGCPPDTLTRSLEQLRKAIAANRI
jgi:cysteine-S-conjugate beta-lyase